MKTFLQRITLLLCTSFIISTAFSQGRGNSNSNSNSNCNLNRVSDTTVVAEKGKNGATVKFPTPNENNACGQIVYNPASESLFPIGKTTVIATPANGAAKTFVVTVLAGEPPAITCPATVTAANDAGKCYATITAIGTPTVTNTDPATLKVNGVRNDGQALTSAYPVGTTTITWTATDGSGLSSTCSQYVIVSDEELPVLTPSFADATAQRNTDAGKCSYAIAGTEFDATAADNCGLKSMTYSLSGATTGSGSGSLSGVVLEKGETTITWTALDNHNNSATATIVVTVVDNQKPVINSVTATPDVLWAPNHKLTDITLTYDVTENCSGLTYQVVSITSNEPVNDIGDGNTAVDWVEGTDGQHLQLRAERSGTGTGRIYTITVKVTDASGNESAPATVTVTVPHDKGNKQGAAPGLDATVAPNPSSHGFTFKASSTNTTDKITMVVSDNMGRPLFRKENIQPGQTITMGSDLNPGTYYVEFHQAGTSIQRRVIKLK